MTRSTIMIQVFPYQITRVIDEENKGYYALERVETLEIIEGSNRISDLLSRLIDLNEERLPEVQV